MRNLLADYVRKLPIDLRTYILPFIYGLFGGLAAVAFQKVVSIIFSMFWEQPSQQMPPGTFALFSLATILAASIIAGLILTFVSRDAAGSGIPQAKVAFWRDFGFMPARVVIAKFFAGAISIGGGCSLGREGPTVHIAGCPRLEHCGMARHRQTGPAPGTAIRRRCRISGGIQYAVVGDYLCP